MSPTTKELMKMVQKGKIAFGGNSVPHWMIDNIYICTDSAGNIHKKSIEKIAGAVATVMLLTKLSAAATIPASWSMTARVAVHLPNHLCKY